MTLIEMPVRDVLGYMATKLTKNYNDFDSTYYTPTTLRIL